MLVFTKRAARAGFTLIEMVIAIGIFGVLIGFATMIGDASRGAYGQATSASVLNAQAKLNLDRIAMEMQVASIATFDPALETGIVNTSSLTFQQLVDINAGVPVYGGPLPGELMSLELTLDDGESADGMDNDGDGLIDEQQLVLTRNVGSAEEVAVTICGNVREFLEGELPGGGDENGNGLTDEAGFDIGRNGDVLTLRLSLEAVNSRGEVLVRTVETAIRLRN